MNIITRQHESALGSWTLSTCRPPFLAGLVDVIWYAEGTATHPLERAFPNGMLQLRVNFGAPYQLVEGAGTQVLATAWLCGLHAGPRVVQVPHRHQSLAAALHPAGAFALLGRSVHDLSGWTVALCDVIGAVAGELVERCQHANSAETRLRLAADWLWQRMRLSARVDPSIAWAAGRIDASGGAVPIAELRAHTGLSKTRLATNFREQIGLPPKVYARIVRFRDALAMLHADAGPLADVALAAGYYDQPHMNADFRELSGLSPREFLAARYPDGVTAFESSS